MAVAGPLPRTLAEELSREFDEWKEEFVRAAEAVYAAGDGEKLYDAERLVASALRGRADRVTEIVLRHRISDSEFEAQAKEQALLAARDAGIPVKSHGRRFTRFKLLGGTEVRLRTLQLLPVPPKSKPGRKRGVGRRGKGGAGVYPALAMLGITGQSTPALMVEVAREVAGANSVAVARESLRERGLDIGHKTALRLTYLLAERGLVLRRRRFDEVARAGPPDDGELAGLRLVVSVDGGRLRTRVNPKAGRRNAKTRHRRYKAPWKEPRVMSVYVLDDEGGKDRGFKTFLDGTMGDADETLALMVGHLRLLGAHQAEHVTLAADGAEWIWERADRLRQAIGMPSERWTEVVDWHHAVEHLHDVAAIPKNWEDGGRQAWLKKAERHLHQGRVDKVLDDIDALRVGRRGKEIGKGARYFRENAERMRYADFRAAGIPCGSGGVESAVRRVVNLRMKGNSMYWLPEHAEAMLHLRAHLKAGRWDELVRDVVNQPVWPRPD